MARKPAPLTKSELQAIGNYQQALGQITELNAAAASADLQSKALQRQIDALNRTTTQENALFSIQEATNLLSRDKRISDLSAQFKGVVQDVRQNYRPQQLGQVKVAENQIYRALEETTRQATFANQEAALQDQSIFYQRQLQQIQKEEQAIQYDVNKQQADISSKSSSTRAAQTKMAADAFLLASQSITPEGK